MRKFMGLALLVSLFSLAAFAQEGGTTPKAEIFGGYQYTRFDGGVNANGWNTSLTGNLNNWFGIAADFSGAYKTQNGVSFSNYTYTFGPVISYRHNEKLHSLRALPGGWLPRFRGRQRIVWIGQRIRHDVRWRPRRESFAAPWRCERSSSTGSACIPMELATTTTCASPPDFFSGTRNSEAGKAQGDRGRPVFLLTPVHSARSYFPAL